LSFVSYAQNFEDVLLHRVFGGQETGFYVDVGAHHPVNGSTTKVFYDRGWSGINVEPSSMFAELEMARPRDVNLQMAVMDRAGEIAFIEDERDLGMSHVVVEENGRGQARMVPCDTLEAIILAHSRGRPVDFIKLDVEGAEVAIVRSTNWRLLRPRVLLVEATLPWTSRLVNQDWEPVLLEQGYVRAFFDGLNCFYIPEEEAPVLLRHFHAPVNVLDRVVTHDSEVVRAALHEQQAAVREQLNELLHVRSELARLTAEQESLRQRQQHLQDEAAGHSAERDRLAQTLQDQQCEAARLATERDAERAAREHQESEVVARAVSVIDYVTQQNLLERIFFRPDGRPVKPLRRVLFHTSGKPRRFFRRVVRHKNGTPRKAFARWVQSQTGLPQPATQQAPRLTAERMEALSFRTPPQENGVSEMRRLAVELENALLTLAMERGADAWPATAPVPPPTPMLVCAPLLLPSGRTAEVECASDDLSVSASLINSGGDWEPHVRSFLQTVVQPDWVCLDIGANLGAHTLSLAVLAHQGRVVAFEADPANYALLSRNAAALAAPKGRIEPIHVALWDGVGTLVIGGADELAGCSFVAEGAADARKTEQRLRAVVDASAFSETALHMRLSDIAAIPLDHWVAANPLPRLDVIKLDVEGAEARVIRGARRTIREHRPILLVEYNPACAESYFGQPADALFRELEQSFAAIHALDNDGSLTRLSGWAALEKRLKTGKGWEDLVCLPDSRAAATSGLSTARSMSEIAPNGVRDRLLAGSRLFFMHVPKTGGISLTRFLHGLFETGSICPQPSGGGVWRYTADDVTEYRLFAGHFDVDFIDAVDPEGLKLTILREPTSRIVSMYDFWRSLRPEQADQFLTDAPVNAPRFAQSHSFSAFLRTDNPFIRDAISNATARQLLGKRYNELAATPTKAVEIAFARLRAFDWYTTTENLTDFLHQLADSIDVPPRGNLHAHRTYSPEAGEPRVSVTRTTPSTADLRYCGMINQIDMKLYRLAMAEPTPQRNFARS
jgi:FkbM family methyltransferase